MVIIERKYWLVKDNLLYFSDANELKRVIQELSWNEIVRCFCTKTDLPKKHPCTIHSGTTITLCIDLKKDIEEIFKELNKDTRKKIRKAEKILEDIEIKLNDSLAYKDFFKLYNDFVILKGHAHPFSEKRFNEYLRHTDVFVFYFKGRLICGILILRDNFIKRARELFTASIRLSNPEDAKLTGILNRYMRWYVIETYKAEGFELYDLGGFDSIDSPIMRFKQSFGGFFVEEYTHIISGSSAASLMGKAGLSALPWIWKVRQRFLP